MGWWATPNGQNGDDPADRLSEVVGELPALDVVRALPAALGLEAALFDDPDEVGRWTIELDGGAVTEQVLAVVREGIGAVVSSYRDNLYRRPNPLEVVDVFAFVTLQKLNVQVNAVVMRDPDLMVRRRFAIDPRTPEPFVDAFCDDSSEIVRVAAYHRRVRDREVEEARDPATGSQRLEELARSKTEAIAAAVAARGALDEVVADALASSEHVAVRRVAAARAELSAPAFAGLVRDPDREVKDIALRNPALPVKLQRAAADHALGNLAIFANPALSPELLAELANSPFEQVYRDALMHRNQPIASLQQHVANSSKRPIIARSPATPLAMLLELASGTDNVTRCALAQRTQLPEMLAEVLGSDRDYDVRTALAKNRRCPQLVLEILALDANVKVRETARATITAIS